jgi:hypothetical protein
VFEKTIEKEFCSLFLPSLFSNLEESLLIEPPTKNQEKQDWLQEL